MTQEQQVIDQLRQEGGYATLKRLNEVVDFSSWKTKTPEATVRRIVQESNSIFNIRPGLWALNEAKDYVLQIFGIESGNKDSEEQFSHGYYQGLLVEIGKIRRLTTYVPAQDKNRKFLHNTLGNIADTTVLPQFSYENLLKKARTIDVIWFNTRYMPACFYEVEHTTDIKNSLSKFYELQDFHAKFYIVADKHRKKEYDDKLNVSMFDSIAKRIEFLSYERVASMHAGLKKIGKLDW